MAKTLGSLFIGDTVEVPVMEAHQTRFGETVIFKIADINHKGYPENSVTLITDKIIQLIAYDGKHTYGSATAKKRGSAVYTQSNIRQWLNSNAEAGKWYKGQNSPVSNDQPPTASTVIGNPYSTWEGFLKIWPESFSSSILDTDWPVPEGTSMKTVTNKFALPSFAEVGLGGTGGEILPVFNSENESRLACLTENSVNVSTTVQDGMSSTLPWIYWIRMYNGGTFQYHACGVTQTGGSASSLYPCYGIYGIRPLCNVPCNMEISNAPNQKGHYVLLDAPLPTPPSENISGTFHTPVSAENQPKAVKLDIVQYTPVGSVFKAEVTNNPFDENPIWEDCTQSVVDGTAYEFKNRINVSGQCGFNVRVSVDKGTATETCWLSGVEGRFT